MKFNRIAITGGSGRLGRFVAAELARHALVSVIDVQPPDQPYQFIKADILERGQLENIFKGHDAVVHLAGIDLDTTSDARAYLNANVIGSWNVLEAAHEAGVRRVILCSSVTATGLSEARPDFPPLYLPVDEDHPLAPVHPYGVSKLMMESAGRSFIRRGGMEVVNLRLMLVLLPHNYELARKRAANPASRWLFYYIEPRDAANAFRCALEAESLPFDTYFVTAADSCHHLPTLRWLGSAFDTMPEVRIPELYTGDLRTSVFDGSRAREVLGFEPMSNWLELNGTTP